MFSAILGRTLRTFVSIFATQSVANIATQSNTTIQAFIIIIIIIIVVAVVVVVVVIIIIIIIIIQLISRWPTCKLCGEGTDGGDDEDDGTIVDNDVAMGPDDDGEDDGDDEGAEDVCWEMGDLADEDVPDNVVGTTEK